MADLLGHGKGLILIRSQIKSCTKVLVRTNMFRVKGFVVLHHLGR